MHYISYCYRYGLWYRRSCVASTVNCLPDTWSLFVSGRDVSSAVIDMLRPYTAYDARISVTNDMADVVYSDITSAVTQPAGWKAF